MNEINEMIDRIERLLNGIEKPVHKIKVKEDFYNKLNDIISYKVEQPLYNIYNVPVEIDNTITEDYKLVR